MTKTFEIYFSDLTEEAQRNLLDFFKLKNEMEMNWDTFPMTILELEVEEE